MISFTSTFLNPAKLVPSKNGNSFPPHSNKASYKSCTVDCFANVPIPPVTVVLLIFIFRLAAFTDVSTVVISDHKISVPFVKAILHYLIFKKT